MKDQEGAFTNLTYAAYSGHGGRVQEVYCKGQEGVLLIQGMEAEYKMYIVQDKEGASADLTYVASLGHGGRNKKYIVKDEEGASADQTCVACLGHGGRVQAVHCEGQAGCFF